MLGQRQMHLELEILKWIVMIALAAAIALALVTHVGGSETKGGMAVPSMLPPDMEQLAQPLEATVAQPAEELPADEMIDWNVQLWSVLELHRLGQIDEAIGAWAETPLPCESEVWRYVSLAAAYLQSGDTENAVEMLEAAAMLEPHNAVVHYYTGVLRLQQAENAPDWYDAVGGPPGRLVSWIPREVSPNTRAMYQLAAMTELERALEMAPFLQGDAVLISLDAYGMETASLRLMPATINDLLLAIGADNFAGKSHNMLGTLCLERGWLEQAESHMDLAAESGLAIVFGYRDLAERFELEGRHMDSVRNYLKAMAQGGEVLDTSGKVLQSFRKALLDLF